MNTTSKLMGVVRGRATSALADALGNLIKSTYITNVTWDSSTHTLAFWGGSVLKYSCVIELAPQPLIDDPTKPLYLLSKQNGSTVTLSGNGTTTYTDIYQTSTDNVTWADYTLGTPITLNSGEGIYFRIKVDKAQVFTDKQFVTFSTSTGVIEAYHNVNSMLSPNFSNLTDLTTVISSGKYCLASLFGPYDGTAPYLTKAPLLPATVLSQSCYFNMFFGCTSLTQAPELPATTLASACCFYMFSECTSLTQAPLLPTTTLAYLCYNSMFLGCSLLSEVRIAATDISANGCLGNWLRGVSSTGGFYCVTGVSYSSNENGIPSGWTRHNINDYPSN